MDANYLPPVNNALLPDIYNKLDADLQEKTRVINTQLDKRLVLQEKVLCKHRLAAERHHKEESSRVRRDLAKITKRLPMVGNIKNFSMGHYVRQRKQPRKRKGIPEERAFMPFCERHYIHHCSTKKMFYKLPTPTPTMPTVMDNEENGVIVAGQYLNTSVDGGLDTNDLRSNVSLSARSPKLLSPSVPAAKITPASR